MRCYAYKSAPLCHTVTGSSAAGAGVVPSTQAVFGLYQPRSPSNEPIWVRGQERKSSTVRHEENYLT